MKDYEELEVGSAEQLRDWLAAHHETAPGVWLVRWKKGRGPYVSHPDVVRELLCVGWIDAQARKVDDDRSAVLVVPRRPGSGWSRINKQHLEELTAEGRMLPAGVAAIDRAKADGSWTQLDEVETLREPDDLRAALDASPGCSQALGLVPALAAARHPRLDLVGQAGGDPGTAHRADGQRGGRRSPGEPAAATGGR